MASGFYVGGCSSGFIVLLLPLSQECAYLQSFKKE